MQPPLVEIRRVVRLHDIYHWYSREPAPQPAFIELDLRSGELSADYDAEVSRAVPESVFHHRVLRFTIPLLPPDAVNELLDEASPVAQRILNGAVVGWNGNNEVGTLDQDAQEAEQELNDLCEAMAGDPRCLGAVPAKDWIEPDAALALLHPNQDASTDRKFGLTPANIERIARETEESALHEGTIIEGTAEYLTQVYRQHVRKLLEETANQLTQLTTARDRQIRCLLRFGDSTRDIGELADLSHAGVQSIGRRIEIGEVNETDLREVFL